MRYSLRDLARRVRWLYNILFTLVFGLASPVYFLRLHRRGNWVAGFWQRFGRYAPEVKARLAAGQPVWIHAVSVGEANTCLHLVTELLAQLPELSLVVSATTTTGMAELRRRLPPRVLSVYFPIDTRRSVTRALGLIRPATVILFEREIWPNFVWRANELGIPLLLVNARMSDRSFRLCRRFRFLFAPLYGSLAAAAAQSEADAEKLRCLGCPPHRVQVLGSLKYDAAVQSDGQSPDLSAPLRRAGAPLSGPILVCGSTHPGEEKVMAEIVQRLRRTVPQLYLILVPRHFERCPEAAKDLDRLGMPYVRWSALSGDSSPPAAEPAGCLLVDTTGLLRALYRAATVVFVGKSLKAMGGQNPIEPAALGKPMVFGPNMQNFREISDRLVAAGGAIRVHNEAELEVALAALLHDQQQRETMGQRARQVILENQGATQRTVQLIRAHLPCGTTEPRPTEQT